MSDSGDTSPPAKGDEELPRLREMFAQSPSFSALLDGPEYRFVMTNAAYQRLIGNRAVIGLTVREAFPEVESQGFLALLDEVFATGKPFVGRDARIAFQSPRDGAAEIHFLDFVYQPVKDESGRVTAIFVEGSDQTERHTTEEALRASEASLRELNRDLERRVVERAQARSLTWQLSPDLLGALNSKGYFETSNPAWRSVLGWSEEEVASMSIFELLHPDDVERTRAGFELVLIDQPALRFVNRYRCKNGGHRWISWVGIQEDGFIYCTGRDITVEKLAEIELAEAQEALRQAQKMEAIGQLTGGLAHDFNNLLTVISGSLERIESNIKRGRPADTDRYIVAAQLAGKRAAALTHRLLAFSRRQTLEPRAIDINVLVAGMDDMIRRTVGPEISVEVVGAGGLWNTLVDPHQLENALLNLCINARDAMPGGGRLTVETANRWLDERYAKERDVPAGQYVSLSVSDTGVGMPPDVVARAFDPFFTTKPIGQGTGLGLSMIYGFARQSGGQVRIYSQPGQGTTVCMYLPRHHGPTSDTMEMSPAIPAHAEAGESVLIVDDEAGVRSLIVEVLADLGYHAIEASDGVSGLKVLQSAKRVDLLVTDVGLPGGMNGRQLADAARTACPDLKVLFITGYAENAAIRGGHLDAGMAVMIKPFPMDVLANRIQEMITGQPARKS